MYMCEYYNLIFMHERMLSSVSLTYNVFCKNQEHEAPSHRPGKNNTCTF